jgi:hypothetical protein
VISAIIRCMSQQQSDAAARPTVCSCHDLEFEGPADAQAISCNASRYIPASDLERVLQPRGDSGGGHPLDPERWAVERSIFATIPTRRWPHLGGGGPRSWCSCNPSRGQSGNAGGSTSAEGAWRLPTGLPGLQRTMTTTSPSSAARSKVGHEVSGLTTAQSNFGIQPTAFGRG